MFPIFSMSTGEKLGKGVLYHHHLVFIIKRCYFIFNLWNTVTFTVQWNLDSAIMARDSKIILLNRDIIVNELPFYK